MKRDMQVDVLLNMRKAICICLAQKPYSLAAFLINFLPKPIGVPVVPPEEMYDRIEFAITCNENVSDTELHLYIIASQGRLVTTLNQA